MDFTVHFNVHRLIFKRNTKQCTLIQPIDYMDLESDYQAYDALKDYEALLQELDSLKLENAYFPDYFLVHEAERYFTMMIRTKHIEECGLKELSDTAKINKMSEELQDAIILLFPLDCIHLIHLLII